MTPRRDAHRRDGREGGGEGFVARARASRVAPGPGPGAESEAEGRAPGDWAVWRRSSDTRGRARPHDFVDYSSDADLRGRGACVTRVTDLKHPRVWDCDLLFCETRASDEIVSHFCRYSSRRDLPPHPRGATLDREPREAGGCSRQPRPRARHSEDRRARHAATKIGAPAMSSAMRVAHCRVASSASATGSGRRTGGAGSSRPPSSVGGRILRGGVARRHLPGETAPRSVLDAEGIPWDMGAQSPGGKSRVPAPSGLAYGESSPDTPSPSSPTDSGTPSRPSTRTSCTTSAWWT